MASEYLHECLVPFMKGKGLLNENTAECKLTADEGIEGCPDGGKREVTPDLGDYSLLWMELQVTCQAHTRTFQPSTATAKKSWG